MFMHWIDWSIVVALVLIVGAIGVYTKRYSRSVSDFLAANRCAGRYLLVFSANAAATGATYFATTFERNYEAGFTSAWWETMTLPLMLVIAVIGWVKYRYRQTRALTMAQFFEMRYSRRFRIFTGILIFVSGILNFGIFPAVACRFFIYFCGIPDTFLLGGTEIQTLIPMMILLLGIALYFTFLGGQISVMVTDFVQGVFENIVFVLIVIFLLWTFDWNLIDEAMRMAPAGKSLVDPMQSSGHANFNSTYFFIQLFILVYGYMAWQGNQGYNAAARTPHESRMATVLNQLRGFGQGAMLLLVPICAYTIMHHPAFAAQAASAKETLNGIANETIRSQMTVPIAIARIIPVGMLGAFAAMMLASFISNHDTLLHSWGSTFIQDVVLPLKKTPLSKEEHMRWLRFSIIGVAVFVFFWSLGLKQTQNAIMYFQITGAIYMGGAGACIIGGLYWRRGTTQGAWWAMLTGAVLGGAGLIVKQTLPEFLPTWMTGQVLGFIAMLVAIGAYVIASLLTCEGDGFDMDRMLHRGKYAPEGEAVTAPLRGWKLVRAELWGGKDTKGWDHLQFALIYAKVFIFFGLFVVGMVMAVTVGISQELWLAYWKYYVYSVAIISTIVVIWLSICGFMDLAAMFRLLRATRSDDRDDGRVAGHHNLADEKPEKAKPL